MALTGASNRAVFAGGVLCDAAGRVVMELQDIRLARVAFRVAAAPSAQMYDLRMEPLAPLTPLAMPREAVTAARAALRASAHENADAALLDRLAAAFAADALLALGESADVGTEHQKLLDRVIRILEDNPAALADGLMDSGEAWRGALATHPQLVAELTLVGRAGRRLAAQLRGEVSDLPVSAMREQLFDGAPLFAQGHAALAKAVGAFAAAWPRNRRLRVLELGAGAGGFSRLLVAALPQAHSETVITDSDDKAVAALETRFAGGNVTVAVGSAIADQSFDLVISANGAPIPANVHPGAGALLLTAAPKPSAWTMLVLGTQDLAETAPPWQRVDRVHVGAMILSTAQAVAADVAALPAAAQDWVLLTDEAARALAEQVAATLTARGHHAFVQAADAPLEAGRPHSLVFLAGMMAQGLAANAARCDALLALLKRAQLDRLVLVTGQAMALGVADSVDPAPAAMIGLGRVLQNERPELNCRIIDLHRPLTAAADALAREIASGSAESEILLAEGGRFAPRLVKTTAPEAPPAEDEMDVLGSPGGSLDHLHWTRLARPALDRDAVEVKVMAAGLNFRDVMFALGVLPDEILEGGFAGASLGMEAAGIVTRIGDGVGDIAVGDPVVCFAPSSLATHLVTRRFAVAKLPDGMDFASGATLIAAFFTVTYALAELARLGRGERILIHGAAGGVGIAALQYARHVGAEIFATAGSPEKREFLSLSGIDDDHILDSRSSDFAAQIRSLTNGEGVDVVLNSLAGEGVHRGLSLLKPFGRFIELGKVDFVTNSRIGLRVFRNNITYHGVDADQLMGARPDLAEVIFRQTIELFAQGVYTPLPHRIFPRAEVVEAFRHMQRSRHIGKIVIAPQPEAAPAASTAVRVTIDSTAAYLVTGGLSGLGLASARWLAGHGARHLVLASRSGEARGDDLAVIAALRADGVRVDTRACDVGDEAQVTALVGEFASSLKGVIHAAAIYDDAFIADMTPGRFGAVLAPKAGGALALDAATSELTLDIFLLYSSISALIGNPGQANYAAANTVLESLAAARRAQGRAAQVVALGPIADTGHLVEREALAATFTKLGMRPLSTAEVLAKLDEIVLGGASGLLVADVKWGKLRGALPSLRAPRFHALVSRTEREDIAGEADFALLAATLAPEELHELLLAQVASAIGQILHVPADKVDREKPVYELGMDSLMGLELRMSIEERFGVQLSTMALSQDVSVRRIAEMIQAELRGTPAEAPEAAAGPTAESEQALILSRHAEHIDSGVIAEAIEDMEGQVRPACCRMTEAKKLSAVEKQALLKRIIESRKTTTGETLRATAQDSIPESFYRIEKFPRYHQMQLHRALADKAGLKSPFFAVSDGVGRDTAHVAGRELLNFSTYNYLGLNGDPRVNAAAAEVAERFGTSASASRIVGGERPPHRALERAIADLHGAESAVVFVSGFVANVTLVSTLVGPRDLIMLDRLVHNSIIQGAKLSEATVQTFPHNDWQALDAALSASRARYERVLIVVEGIYSMEGDLCPLPQLVEVKQRHKALLMVDEAHSMGVLGARGAGIGEHFGVPAGAVDVWMGTLSKTFAGCGGYAAGSAAMVELMKFTAPGFVFSVGMPPPMAAASLKALELMLAEPQRIAALNANGRIFLEAAQAAGLNTGVSAGHNIVPIIVGSSVTAARLSNALMERGAHVNPIVFPAVEEKQARLRFFLSSDHRREQLENAIAWTAEELKKISLL